MPPGGTSNMWTICNVGRTLPVHVSVFDTRLCVMKRNKSYLHALINEASGTVCPFNHDLDDCGIVHACI